MQILLTSSATRGIVNLGAGLAEVE
jgi:hypothetical protein